MKVAVAGLGWWGKQIVSCLEKSARFEVLYGVDPSPPDDITAFQNTYGFRLEADLNSVLSDPDLDGVILATPHAFHEEQALQVLAAGKELFCEKPLCMTAAGAERVVAACVDAGKVLGIGHERRYEPAFEELQRLVAQGELGKLLAFEANVSHDQFRNIAATNWRLNPTHAPAAMMTAVGIHITDLFAHLAGPVAEVRARTDSMILSPAEDFVTASIQFKSGVHATFTSLSATPFYSRFAVFGDAGWVEIIGEANVDRGKPTHLIHSDAPERRKQVTYDATDTVTMNFEAWADAVEGKAAYRFTPQELIDNIKIFEAIVKSAANAGAPQTP